MFHTKKNNNILVIKKKVKKDGLIHKHALEDMKNMLQSASLKISSKSVYKYSSN